MYSPPAAYTAATLIRTGHWKEAGLDQMIVKTHERRSNTFWNEVSTVENVPRQSPCTSWTSVSHGSAWGLDTHILHDVLH